MLFQMNTIMMFLMLIFVVCALIFAFNFSWWLAILIAVIIKFLLAFEVFATHVNVDNRLGIYTRYNPFIEWISQLLIGASIFFLLYLSFDVLILPSSIIALIFFLFLSIWNQTLLSAPWIDKCRSDEYFFTIIRHKKLNEVISRKHSKHN